MNAYEIADELQKHGLNGDNHGLFNKRIQNMLRQQADRIAELEETINACYTVQKMQAEEVYKGNDRIAELEFENKAFRKELFNIGSMRSCSYAAQHHGFVFPRQAGDDAREYIAEILDKAKAKEGK